MNGETISKAIEALPDDILAEAEQIREKGAAKSAPAKNRKPLYIGAASAACAAAAAVGIIAANIAGKTPAPVDTPPESVSQSVSGSTAQPSVTPQAPGFISLAAPVYPPMAPYPDESLQMTDPEEFERQFKAYCESQINIGRKTMTDKYIDSVWEYCRRAAGQFLGEAGDENMVISPINIYMALAMTAETTDGESRAQILELLGADDIGSFRDEANNLWKFYYSDDGAFTNIPASSLWLSECEEYGMDVINTLAEKYYAYTFSGDAASDEMNEALRGWLNEQTGGLLEEYVSDISLDPSAVMELCSTIYFQASWGDRFDPNDNSTGTFSGTKGDTEAEFMNRRDELGVYYYGEDFGAIRLGLADAGDVWFILPDEGKSVDDVINSGEYLEMIRQSGKWKRKKDVIINMSVPKFDVSSRTDLKSGLEALGVTDIFDVSKADFTPVLPANDDVSIGRINHAVRVMIDEDGVTAASLVEMEYVGEADPLDDLKEIDFVLDRPFIFAVACNIRPPALIAAVNNIG